jgi:hypothetical protein
MSRRKYYRINTDELDKLSDVAQRATSMLPKKEDGKWTKQELPLKTKTTAETSSKTTKGAFLRRSTDVVFEKPKYSYPASEEEMYSALEHNAIEPNPDYDGNFFASMEKCGWTIKGKPVWDWMETYKSRLQVTAPENLF